MASKDKKYTYFIVGATDRNNFGDLLFPHIINRYIIARHPESEIRNYAFLKSDLSDFGAIPTESYRQLFRDIRNEPFANVVMAGGTLLGAEWSNFLAFSSKFYSVIYRLERRWSLVKRAQIARRWVSPEYLFHPFILDHELFKDARICYNSVGGITLKHSGFEAATRGHGGKFWDGALNHLRTRVAHMSVRNRQTEAALLAGQVTVHLAPDCATLISETFETAEIEDRASSEAVKLSRSRYCLLQMSGDRNKQPSDLERFAKTVEVHASKLDMKVILCPMGLALGHEDQRPLKSIAKYCPSFIYYEPRSIFDTLQLLGNSSLFIGTSLHGVLVSTVYGRPTYYFREISKVSSYMSTWFDDMGCTSLETPERAFLDPDLPRLVSERSKKIPSQMQLVSENLTQIAGTRES